MSRVVRDQESGTESDETVSPTSLFDEPTHLPGVASVTYSPMQFYALTQAPRTDVDAASVPGLFLHEAPCPTVSKRGIVLAGREFSHERIQEFVAGLPGTPKRDLVIRYNRARLARGVLTEVVLCERDARGTVHEALRLRPRDRVLAEVDLNAVLRERARIIAVLQAKCSKAKAARLTLAAGTAALERLRDEQAARAQWQKRQRHDPIAAKPIRAKNHRDVAAQDAAGRVAALAEHLEGGIPVDRVDVEAATIVPDTREVPTASPTADAPATRGRPRRNKAAPRGDVVGSVPREPVSQPASEAPAPARERAATPARSESTKRAGVKTANVARTPSTTTTHLHTTTSPTSPALPPLSLLEEFGGPIGFIIDDSE